MYSFDDMKVKILCNMHKKIKNATAFKRHFYKTIPKI